MDKFQRPPGLVVTRNQRRRSLARHRWNVRVARFFAMLRFAEGRGSTSAKFIRGDASMLDGVAYTFERLECEAKEEAQLYGYREPANG